MFLLEGGSEAIRASVAIKAKGSRFVRNRFPVREDEDRWRGEFREKGANGVLHGKGEFERSAFFLEGRDRAYMAGHVRQKRAVIAKAAK